jgi:predicted transcriptional regulator
MPKTYPRPGTNAEHILDAIKDNPGVSATGIINRLGLNPSPARACIKALLEHGLITDEVDDNGHHHYTAKPPKLDG